MVTTAYKLEQINDGYRTCWNGKNIRGVIRYTDDRPPAGDSHAPKRPNSGPDRVAVVGGCVQAHDRAGWLALMADDVVRVEDPIGAPSPIPMAASKVRGRRRLFDTHIAPIG